MKNKKTALITCLQKRTDTVEKNPWTKWIITYQHFGKPPLKFGRIGHWLFRFGLYCGLSDAGLSGLKIWRFRRGDNALRPFRRRVLLRRQESHDRVVTFTEQQQQQHTCRTKRTDSLLLFVFVFKLKQQVFKMAQRHAHCNSLVVRSTWDVSRVIDFFCLSLYPCNWDWEF